MRTFLEKYRNSWLYNASLKGLWDWFLSARISPGVCSSRTSQNEHLSIKCTLSYAFVKHSSQLLKGLSFFPPASHSISLVIPRTNRPLLGLQCFKHSWMSVGTARSPTARIRNSRNMSACAENLRFNLFFLMPYWVMSPFLFLHTSAEDLILSSYFAAFFPLLSRCFLCFFTLVFLILIDLSIIPRDFTRRMSLIPF